MGAAGLNRGDLAFKPEQALDPPQPVQALAFELAARRKNFFYGVEHFPALVHVSGKHTGDCLKRCFVINKQHIKLLSRHRLELFKRKTWRLSGTPHSAQGVETALIDAASGRTRIEEAASAGFDEPTLADPGFQFCNALLCQPPLQR